ncbi:hypothetical protein [Phenylobacterium aquaticum]|uniref:hypothetical protein n=1 Tax=Phenylobacterium aquaticum TaxID=1763816 RepID=UPI0026F33238|nr:hypothetical protein [Phenylobacterium aquaticum]
MSIAAVGGPPPAKPPEGLEAKGPELIPDHDTDDSPAAVKPSAALPPGQGVNLDTKA